MTEAEWLACDDPQRLARYLFCCTSPRKLRLWACACGREVVPDFEHPLSSKALELFEGVAEGTCLREDQQQVLTALQSTRRRAKSFSQAVAGIVHSQWIEMTPGYESHFALGLKYLACAEAYKTRPKAKPTGLTDPPSDPVWLSTYTVAQKTQLAIANDIFGNPFRPVTFSAEWRTPTVLTLAQQMYESRDFSAVPILADALQDAGCDNEDILNHCRGHDPHVRGCWVLDAVLGKG